MEAPLQRSYPAGLKDPLLQAVFPVGALGMNTPGELEGIGIELEDRDAAEAVGVGIEYLVVVDFVVLPENPFAVRLQIGLSGFALDLVAQNLLLAVGMRYVDLIEDEQAHGENGAEHDDGECRAVNAHAAGFHCRQLARLLHQPEGDENGKHDRQRRDQIDERRAYIPQVLRPE